MFTIANIQNLFLPCVRYYEHSTMSRFRKLKIHSKFRTRRWDNTTVPEIRLEGKWLDALGFKQGQKVKIQVEANKLTITIDNGIDE